MGVSWLNMALRLNHVQKLLFNGFQWDIPIPFDDLSTWRAGKPPM